MDRRYIRVAACAAARTRGGPPHGESADGENLAQWYLASADRILEGYRTRPDPWLYEFDWPKAEICLDRAVQLGAGDGDLPSWGGSCVTTLERLNGGSG